MKRKLNTISSASNSSSNSDANQSTLKKPKKPMKQSRLNFGMMGTNKKSSSSSSNEDSEGAVVLVIDEDNDENNSLKTNFETNKCVLSNSSLSSTNSLSSQFSNSLENIHSSVRSSSDLLSPILLGIDHPYDMNQKFKFISWNVNGISAIIRKQPNYLKRIFENEMPICVCLQETKLSTDIKIADMQKFHFKGYESHFNTSEAKKGYSGTAVYILKKSPYRVVRVKFGIGIEKHDQEGRCITVEFEKFYLVNTYCPNSGQNLERLDYRTKEWDIDLLKYFEKLEKKKPVIWTGDLNVALTPIDIHNPEGNVRCACYTPEERSSTPIVTKTNPPFIDAFRLIHGNKKFCYTYYGYRNNKRDKKEGCRIDYFICSEPLKPYIEDCYILEDYYGSDHLPIGLILSNSSSSSSTTTSTTVNQQNQPTSEAPIPVLSSSIVEIESSSSNETLLSKF
ncbi:hypothetical protein C9374_012901 [Naegleria lovaniensis]|uniref:DNA-(apurinic or apyrimidinic site) endonuclease n=1 Tax=Naegleria lovaniensis TaxID=51637 RepID=A0AA88KBF8_NAELO|nr:uncharacterized protein C9374_012901 [Naegleria lovaniensis]KAG2373055.1 hypothetical protein C9374_012901 [Naegleria lovaniensis]